MPPRPKYTKESIISAALELVRENGTDALTARSLGKHIGASAPAIFTYFSSMEEIHEAVFAAAWEMYGTYARRGLSMVPPFKGFAMEFIRFAENEPKLFEQLFMHRQSPQPLESFIGTEGHEEEILSAVMHTFGLNMEQAKKLYRNLWAFTYGIASMTAAGACRFLEEELSEMLGTACRGFLMVLLSPEDNWTGIMPQAGGEIDGTVESYIGLREDTNE